MRSPEPRRGRLVEDISPGCCRSDRFPAPGVNAGSGLLQCRDDGAVTVGAWCFAFFLAPDTRGKTLEQTEAHMRSGKHPRAL